jgi:hypothetical protein
VNDAKYIGLDVHQATISATVLDSTGKLVMESILETKAATILQFIHGLRGSLHVTLEEGTCAGWLHDLLKPHVTRVLVCDPRRNALLKPQPRSEKYLQGCSHSGRRCRRTFPGVLRGFACQRNATTDGASHLGAQNRRHHFDRLEERSALRHRTSETTSSLSVWLRTLHPWDASLTVVRRFLSFWFGGEYPQAR